MLTKSGHATVTSVKKQSGHQRVYNLEVKDWHNFLVGDDGVVVHNSCWGGKFTYKGFLNPMKAIDHIWDLHSYAKRQPGVKSYFKSQYSTPGKIKKLVQEAIAKGAKNMVKRDDGSFTITVDMGRVIGKDLSNNNTRFISVILHGSRVNNAFPGFLSK